VLGEVHKLRPRPFIEALSTDPRRERATEDVVALGWLPSTGLPRTPRATAGSPCHDLALGLC
jgi:hypothetical protein